MGNYYCKSFESRRKCSDVELERIWYKAVQKKQNKMAKSLSYALRPRAKPTTSLLPGNTDVSTAASNEMSVAEFKSICSRNRPAGISESNWEKFLLSCSLEWFQINDNREAQFEAASTTSLQKPLGGGVDTGTDTTENEDSQSLISYVNSTAEYARGLEFPSEGSDNYTAELISLECLSTPSTLDSLSTLSSAKCLGEFPPRDVPEMKFDLKSNLRYTTISLGDLRCNSNGKYLSDSENKASTTSSSTKTELLVSKTGIVN